MQIAPILGDPDLWKFIKALMDETIKQKNVSFNTDKATLSP
jgi:hypothetical protein